MSSALFARRAVLIPFCLLSPTLLAVAGCGGSPAGSTVVVNQPPTVVVEQPGDVVVVPGTFGIDLVNETPFSVDPGVAVDQFVLDLGTLAPLEGNDVPLPFDIDCLPGDTLTIDPTQFRPLSDVVAANAPIILHEGVDYVCGDILTLFFTEDATGTFFVDVAVNGVVLGF